VPTRSIPWPRILAEGFAIVVSILLAFGIQAWWEGRQERALELKYVERLRADLEADTIRFNDIEVAFSIKVGVLRDLLRANGTPLPVRDANELMARLDLSTYNAVTQISSATFHEMESSGALRLLDDVSLRNALTEYYAFYENLAGILADPPGPYQNVLSEVLPGELWYAAKIDSTRVDAAALERGLRALAAYPGLEGILNSEMSYASDLIYYTRRFKADATSLLDRLDQAYPA